MAQPSVGDVFRLGFQGRKAGEPGLGQCSTHPEERKGGREEGGVRDQIRVKVCETGKRSLSHSQFLQFTLSYSSGKRWKCDIGVSV